MTGTQPAPQSVPAVIQKQLKALRETDLRQRLRIEALERAIATLGKATNTALPKVGGDAGDVDDEFALSRIVYSAYKLAKVYVADPKASGEVQEWAGEIMSWVECDTDLLALTKD